MGNGYNHHLHHQNMQLHHKATFLPMLCSRPSIKDVALPRWEERSVSISNDPLSPKIGCMGQVKRNNKIVGFPTSNNKLITTKSDANFKYAKLKRIFSGKNIPTSATSKPSSTISQRRKEGEGRAKSNHSRENSVSISIDEMDPPLPVPVVKKMQKAGDGGETDSLWTRRSGGSALKGLQLQQVQLNRHVFAPTTV